MTVYIVTKNSDFTEGRGSMLFHSAWQTLELAMLFVMNQSGIYGSQQRQEKSYREGVWSFNGYDISEVEVRNNYDPEHRQKAYDKVAELKDLLKQAEAEAAKYI